MLGELGLQDIQPAEKVGARLQIVHENTETHGDFRHKLRTFPMAQYIHRSPDEQKVVMLVKFLLTELSVVRGAV